MADSCSRRLQVLSNQLVASHQASLRPNVGECCGIIACIGPDDAFKYLIEGLHILESRGYDSAGVATVDLKSGKNELTITKMASKGSTSDAIGMLEQNGARHAGHQVGIAHTRWATHGAKTDYNAHPHTDMKGRVALVHNGVIENANTLKSQLQEKGIKFLSETDTEVIAQLIGYYLAQGLSSLEAVNKAQSEMEGTWGLAIIDRTRPNEIMAACNGSPILIGVGNGRMFLASEAAAFGQHTKEYIALENGEVAVITANGHSLDRSRVELASNETIEQTPAPYTHWTIKEIMEQPQAISRALNYGGRLLDDHRAKLGGLDDRASLLVPIKHLVIAACGTSMHAGIYGALLMRWLNAFETVQVVDASEINRDTFPHQSAGLLVLSQSGETKDVHRAVVLGMQEDIPCFSVVNAVRSLIARTTSCGVYLNAGRENAVASTKAFTCQVVVLALIGVWFSQVKNTTIAHETKRKQVIDALHRLPTNIGMGLHKIRDQCKGIASRLVKMTNCFVLGKGYAEPIAREASLKIKEITYVHAEGYPGGALKHGPFALIEKGTPIFMIILEDEAAHMITAAQEVRARQAHVIIITTPNLKKKVSLLAEPDDIIVIPTNGVLTPLLTVLPFQVIAYELAVLKGINPDRPRNLAKAVTVD